MQFLSAHYRLYQDEISRVAAQFGLDVDALVVQSYTPENSAIFIESVSNRKYKIHINLQENRIISVQQLNIENGEEADFNKYLTYMK